MAGGGINLVGLILRFIPQGMSDAALRRVIVTTFNSNNCVNRKVKGGVSTFRFGVACKLKEMGPWQGMPDGNLRKQVSYWMEKREHETNLFYLAVMYNIPIAV